MFFTLFPEFEKTREDRVRAFISIATTRVPSSVWQGNTTYAQGLLTAHMLVSTGRKGEGAAGGSGSQEAVGDLSRSYNPMYETGSGDAALMGTRYGVDFVALRNETVIGMGTMRGSY